MPKQPLSALFINVDTKEVLWARNASMLSYPASLTKLMTLYLIFEALEKQKIKWNSKLIVSKYAAEQEPSKLWLKDGEYVTVRDAVYGVIVKSANDAAVVLSESLFNNRENFIRLMNIKAVTLGMVNTVFKNSTGLNDREQVTTAYDLLKLVLALQNNFPKYYPFFSRRFFMFNNQEIHSHNLVTKIYLGANGVKTGYTNASGFNLLTSVSRNNMRILGIIMGSSSGKERDNMMIKILDSIFLG